ncbi:MAG: ABATE domain-containing protein [Chloroflexi bacterium]|nr:ABATE domain-containing protein [Chloroflexota bacterium]
MSNDSRLCLDFANTMEMHASDHPQETLHNYADLVNWAQDQGLITNSESLLHLSQVQPSEAERVLEQAHALREVIYRIYSAQAVSNQSSESDLAEINAAISEAISGARIIQSNDGFEWEWKGDEDALDAMISPIVRSAGELLTSDALKRVGQCADERGCGWLFIDTSKNRSRRWCSMGDCGNRAKQRRHYQSKQQ